MHPSIMQPISTRIIRRRPARRQRRARLLRLLGILVLAIAMVVLLQRVVQTSDPSAAAAVTTYTVRSGDTLWDIAVQHNSGGDVRHLVTAIKQANHLATVTVHPGQELLIPVPKGR